MAAALPETADRTYGSPAPASRFAAPGPAAPEALRGQAAARLAAHRQRRERLERRLPDASHGPLAPVSNRAARIAATVADRYARTPSYHAMLAAEAERAAQKAQAAAEVAVQEARLAVIAQQQLLDEIYAERMEDGGRGDGSAAAPDVEALSRDGREGQQMELARYEAEPQLRLEAMPAPAARTRSPRSTAPPEGLKSGTSAAICTVRLYDPDHAGGSLPVAVDLIASANPSALRWVGAAPAVPRLVEQDDRETLALDEEISFRMAPVFEESAGPPVPLPANVIEFPRQLVAPRKARPRYAEGPLRDEEAASGDGSQLRIFEVDPAEIGTTVAVDQASTAQWTSLWLDAPLGGHRQAAPAASVQPVEGSEVVPTVPVRPQTASFARRVTAGLCDSALVLAGTLLFVGAAASVLSVSGVSVMEAGAGRYGMLSEGVRSPLLWGVAAGLLVLFSLVYRFLFFSFAEATPGMRRARVAFCSFEDENPTRAAIRRRALLSTLSAGPLGLGFLWAGVDRDRLTWHDRLTRMYPRSY